MRDLKAASRRLTLAANASMNRQFREAKTQAIQLERVKALASTITSEAQLASVLAGVSPDPPGLRAAVEATLRRYSSIPPTTTESST